MKLRPSILTSLLVLLVFSSCAQIRVKWRKNYYTGYVVTNYGDTLHGRIKLQHNFTNKIRFVGDNDTAQRPVNIQIADITSMRLNLLIFEKVLLKGKLKMFEKVAYGYYDLFAYNFSRGEVSENRYLLRLKDQTIRVEPRNFKEIMERFLFDCPEVRQKVIAKQFEFNDTIDIFRTYNRWKKTHP